MACSELGLDPRDRRGQGTRVRALQHHLDLRDAAFEARVRADEHAGVAVSRRLQNVDDRALRRPVPPPPALDRRSCAELIGDRLEHRLHLGREARQDVDVRDREAGSAAERILERPAPLRQERPARRVLRRAREARAERSRNLGLLDLRNAERRGDRLAREVVGRAAEAAGDDHRVLRGRVLAHERGNAVDLVGDRGDQLHLDAQRRQPPREPAAVGVLRVARDDLVPDRDDRGARHPASIAQARPSRRTRTPISTSCVVAPRMSPVTPPIQPHEPSPASSITPPARAAAATPSQPSRTTAAATAIAAPASAASAEARPESTLPGPRDERAYGSQRASGGVTARDRAPATTNAAHRVALDGKPAERRRLDEDGNRDRSGTEAPGARVAHDLEPALAVAGPKRVRRVGEPVEVERARQHQRHRHAEPTRDERRQWTVEPLSRKSRERAHGRADEGEEGDSAPDVVRAERDEPADRDPRQERDRGERITRPHR